MENQGKGPDSLVVVAFCFCFLLGTGPGQRRSIGQHINMVDAQEAAFRSVLLSGTAGMDTGS